MQVKKSNKNGWSSALFCVTIIVLGGWLIHEHFLRKQVSNSLIQVSDSLILVPEREDAYIKIIDSLQYVISQTDDKILLMSDDNFDDFISMSHSHLVIIDYYGKWCSPCRKLDPILYDIVRTYHEKVTVGRYIVEDFKEKICKKN